MAAVAPPLPVPLMAINTMTAWGLILTDENTFATQIFMDNFTTCKYISNEDIDDTLKTFSILTITQGQIRLLPASKKNIKAFTQWTKAQFWLGINPTTLAFPVDTTAELLRRFKTHKCFAARSDAIAFAAKPDKLTKDTKWEYWAPYLLNYFRAIPGRDGVPLKYIVRANKLPDTTSNSNFLDDYIMNAPLTEQAFTIDAEEVHTLIVNLITQNDEAESIIKIFEDERSGQKDWAILQNHYDRQGIYANDMSKVYADLNNLFYGGKKKPQTWWIEFERRINLAFQTYVKREGRVVHLDEKTSGHCWKRSSVNG